MECLQALRSQGRSRCLFLDGCILAFASIWKAQKLNTLRCIGLSKVEADASPPELMKR